MMKQTTLKFGIHDKQQIIYKNLQDKGLTITNQFINKQEEKYILKKLEQQQWSNDLKRKTIQYGYKYNYHTKKLQQSNKPIPYWLHFLIKQKPYNQIIVNNYQKGQSISKHTDHKDYFKNQIMIISLMSDCQMIFNKKGQKSLKIKLKRRSRLMIKDQIRYEWTHQITSVKQKRISITFRHATL